MGLNKDIGGVSHVSLTFIFAEKLCVYIIYLFKPESEHLKNVCSQPEDYSLVVGWFYQLPPPLTRLMPV